MSTSIEPVSAVRVERLAHDVRVLSALVHVRI
jgi:hypothetical protein